MEVKSPAVKRHYDITMSRRTRKQQQQQSFNQVHQANEIKPSQQQQQVVVVVDTTKNEVSQEKETCNQTNNNNVDDHAVVVKESSCESESDHHKSLKQLIKGDEKKGRKELGEHFTEEEKNLQLVSMQQKDNIQGVKFKKLVRRYAKVLGHLMKAKRDPPLGDAGKKPLFSYHLRGQKNI